jgi:methyltransferase family protein
MSISKATTRPQQIREWCAELRYLAWASAVAPVRHRTRRSNDRWFDGQALDESWDERSRLMARSIPAARRVVDVGAGAQALRSALPPDCIYVPIDVVSRTPDTIVCDLNHDQPPALSADYLVASGLLEYITDVPRLVSWMASVAPQIVLSYEGADGQSRYYRRRSGWVNDYTDSEVRELLGRHGLSVVESAAWRLQTIYWLART